MTLVLAILSNAAMVVLLAVLCIVILLTFLGLMDDTQNTHPIDRERDR